MNSLNWKLSYSDEKNSKESEQYTATVPGCVQFDMQKALDIPSIYQGDNQDKYYWMSKKFWHYRTKADILNNDTVPYFVIKGADYQYEIYINGKFVLAHEGMFSPCEVELKKYAGNTVAIEVILFPAPQRPGIGECRGIANEASASCKAAFCYGWDWSPRFITVGISDEAGIEYRPNVHFFSVDASYKLSDDFKNADVILSHTENTEGKISYSLVAPDGKTVVSGKENSSCGNISFSLKNPMLWWPIGHGEHPIYKLIVSISDGNNADTRTMKIGFRRAKIVPNEGVWGKQLTASKTCDKAPMTFEINGRRIFIKGTNFVPPELCRSKLTENRIKKLLDQIEDMNMNTIRIWGGGYIYPDYFYDICDEKGILFWQEFPLACANYDAGEHYLGILKQESEVIIKKLKNHPALMMWCGGNELFNSWSKMTPQSAALRLLDMQTYTLDPETPYNMTSPMYGTGHGDYDMIVRDGREAITSICDKDFIAYTEFGCGAPSELEYLRPFMTEEEINGSYKEGIWKSRHASGGCGLPMRWFDPSAIEKLSGCNTDLKSLTETGNEIQSVMYNAIYEEVRRQWPMSSMAINWCFNEPWQTAAGNSLVNYPDIPKKSYYGVKDALRNQKFSLRFKKISWKPGEELEIGAWLLNDSDEVISGGTAKITVVYDGNEQEIGVWNFESTKARTNTEGEIFKITVPKTSDNRFTIRIESEEIPRFNAEYRLFSTDKEVKLRDRDAGYFRICN